MNMKTISKFNCGPAFAQTKINLVVFNEEEWPAIAKRFGHEGKRNIPGGFVHLKEWRISRGTKPIFVVINADGGDPKNRPFRTLPHELTHLIGILEEEFRVSAGQSEPVAYLSGYLFAQFQPALLKYLGYEIKKRDA